MHNATPLVSVLMCHHLPENRKYLDACLRSLEAQEGCDFEVILAYDNYEPEGLPSYVRKFRVADGLRWVHKINVGARQADPESKYFFLLNDDVILAKHTIATLARKCANFGVVMNPMSQCDNGWLFNANITLNNPGPQGKYSSRQLTKRFYAFEELAEWQDAIIHHKPGPDLVHFESYVCFYATMIPRTVWNAVGQLDEGCLSSHDDEDYCMRARKLGVPSAIDFESFALHFGGATSAKTTTDQDRAETLAHFNKKWK